MIIYLILFQYVSKHNKEMAENNVISNDVVRRRRQINVLSLYAQMSGFSTEVFYQILLLVSKVIERKYYIQRMREIANAWVMYLYVINSMALIFASSELRKKFFELFKRGN